MRMNYRQMQKMIARFSESQLDCDVTIEDSYGNAWAADLRIIGLDSDTGLQENHPVIKDYNDDDFPGDEPRITDAEFDTYLNDLAKNGGFGPVCD